jgi:potassium/hydrogen antiporter
MFLVDAIILISGLLILLGIASSKLSARLGMPVLVLFLVVGMLAGEEGIGRIKFDDFRLAHGIGTVALSLILFDGGLDTPLSALKRVWKPALSLAVPGVLITALITGLAASWILGLSTLEGALIGSIVASTDAAAVFSVLRSGGVSLSQRLQSLLEVESGSNDPMAIFLTISCIWMLQGQLEFGLGMLGLFVSQMAVGAIFGIIGGLVAVRVVNSITLDSAGLYPILVTGMGLLIFGLAVVFKGSGFLAVYLAGIVIGNNKVVFQRGIRLFHDASAWLAQIVMFIVLGMLSTPSRLLDVAWQGLLVGGVLIFVARPVAVLLTTLPFRFNVRELTFISWVGLKGAVPITLATFPLMLNTVDAPIPSAPLVFDIVFFVVVLSAVIQGWSLPTVARWLGLQVPLRHLPPVQLEISSLHHVDGDIVDYTVGPDSRTAHRRVRDLALPQGVVIALVARHREIIPPQGDTVLIPGDHVMVVLKPETRPLVDRIFADDLTQQTELPQGMEFPLRASITVAEFEEMYGIALDVPRTLTLADALRQKLKEPPTEGHVIHCKQVALRIRSLAPDGTIHQVGLIIDQQEM